ncbi:MAG: hypothetical protein MJZ64_05310 [Paludibacteraceae bacterium]|nr:hypothetical protein [Paludibacteraceae bacterium]
MKKIIIPVLCLVALGACKQLPNLGEVDVVIVPNNIQLEEGATKTISVSDGAVATWTSLADSIATVSPTQGGKTAVVTAQELPDSIPSAVVQIKGVTKTHTATCQVTVVQKEE